MSTFNGAITRVKEGRKCGRVKEGRKGGGRDSAKVGLGRWVCSMAREIGCGWHGVATGKGRQASSTGAGKKKGERGCHTPKF
jgi:hypothetical protein